MIRILTITAPVAALLALAAQAQNPIEKQAPGNPQGQAATTPARAPVADPLFASAAAAGGLLELTAAQLGTQRATDPQLKQFSDRMVQEHTKANQELMALAARKGIALPRTLDPRAQFCAQSLSGLSGRDFDICYAKAQLVIHLDSVAMFEAEAERGQDPELKAYAARWLPHIQDHLRTIRPIAMRYEQERPSEGRGTPDHDRPQPPPAQPAQPQQNPNPNPNP